MLTPVERLKFYLLSEGLTVEEEAKEAWIDLYGPPLSLSEYASTSGLGLVLPGELYVNAPFTHPASTIPAAKLLYDDGFLVSYEGAMIPARPIPVPAYHQVTYTDDTGTYAYTDLGVTHTDRCRVSPIAGCAWKCQFCDLPYEFRYRKKPRSELLNVITLAEADHLTPARHVLISGGTPRRADEPWIDGIYAHLAANTVVPVDVMMPPRRDPGYPRWLRDAGINALSVNMEVSDWDRAEAVAPNKARLMGRNDFLVYVEHAVDAFGIGFVQSLLVIGSAMEPSESTLNGIADLANRGCIPVLSPFRPHLATPMAREAAATFEEMTMIYEEALRICSEAGTGVRPGPRCIPCHHNTVALPDGSEFYVPIDGDLTAPCQD